MEKIEKVELVDDKSKPFMVVNTEWGNFGVDGALNDVMTDVDRDMDKITLRPGTQTCVLHSPPVFFQRILAQLIENFAYSFEKMVSSLYICELIRVSMIKCAEQNYLFHGEVPERIKTKGALTAESVYIIEK